MKRLKKLTVLVAFGLMQLGVFAQNFTTQSFSGLPFEMPAVEIPVFKADTLNITAYGAKGDGKFLNTKAIQTAIDAASQNGGGVVLIPAGYWVSGPIELRSHVNLHVASGALLKFSSNLDLYPLIWSFWEGEPAFRCQSPISALNLENIAITGKGVIDGTGEDWRFVKKGKMTNSQWTNLIKKGGVLNDAKDEWYPDAGAMKAAQLIPAGKFDYKNKELLQETKRFFRPVLISLISSKRVLLDGPTFQNSPAWNIHPLMCEHLTVRNLTVRNPWYSQNGDGIDIESCRIGSVTNCNFDVGDDAICIKSGRDAAGRERNMPTELFVIQNNIVYHGHGGVVVGSEMSGGVRNLYVSDCTFLGTDCGLRFKSTRGRGGVVENIWFKDIYMADIPTEAIRFNLFYGGKSAVDDDSGDVSQEPAVAVSELTPQFRNMYIENVWCTNAKAAVLVRGLPEMPVQNIQIKNLNIETEQGVNCVYGQDILIDGFNLTVRDKDAITIQNSKNVEMRGLNVDGFSNQMIVVKGEQTSNIRLVGGVKPLSSKDVTLIGTKTSEVKLK